MRSILDSIAIRLDEARDISRYMTGLLIFLGLLGTFWGLIETVSSVGSVINNLKVGGDAGAMFDTLHEGLAAPLSGMGISFSSSLFGLAGSLVLGFLDLQMSQAQNRFYTELEDWLATTVHDLGGADRRRDAMPAGGTLGRDAASRSSGCARRSTERRLEQGRDHRHGEPRRSHPGPGPAHAHRAADDPRLGRLAGRAAPRNPPAARAPGARARRQVTARTSAMTWPRPRPPRSRRRLLAGLRRRAVDADPRHHLPAHGVRGRAVLPVAGDHRQGHRAVAAVRADRAADRAAVAGADRQGCRSRSRSRSCAPASPPPKASATATRASTKASAAAPRPRRARSTELTGQLDAEKQVSLRALAQVEVLNQQIAALRRQLGALEQALEVVREAATRNRSRASPISASG